MASLDVADGVSDSGAFQAAGDPNADVRGSFPVDPVASEISISTDIKDAEKETAKNEEEAGQTLKSVFIFSGVVVALIGAIFAVSKKLRET
ncbi:hypothetical protein AMTRI_Chr11g96650 [Amborella trichopoda]|uniref:Uncharacterized protein n=1 Tax=Amborella trichopoda TaxID=13333 RepID=U5D2Z9_AMBTC|nr:uncharacterized protein LOC18444912 [Amborella trichopoda]ERN16595.1 hypothetical protein AMTR_s00031p00242320 [Amborella trichopoda]|eukprot:XP_006855128.1 uncharacterized protein LOC18444912 [Amborella trichopoda]